MRIAILGYGVEGESVYNYYHALYPDAQFIAYDNKSEPKNSLPDGVEFVGNVKDFKNIQADIAVKTPAIAPWNVNVTGEVTTMTREFIKRCPAPIIGVTGTKGKGTTSSLIKSILDAAGKKTWLVGNIGVGAFDVLSQISPDDIVVYELSSFQLWDLDVSPHVAVVLGIEPEHLDVHKDMADYVTAKANIAAHQKATDVVVYKDSNKYAADIARRSVGEHVPYQSDVHAHVRDNYFYYGEQQLCPVDMLRIPGVHNQDNACAAITAVWPWVQDSAVITRGLATFEGLPYRIQLLRDSGGVRFYNDSYSTSPAATDVALQAVGQPTVLIAGGYDRGFNHEELAQVIMKHQSVKKVLLIGQTGPKVAEHLPDDYYKIEDSLKGAVARAYKLAEAGDVILFSPGFASFDMFRDFNDRGQQFTELVEQL